MVKNLPASTGDTRDAGLIPGSGRSPGVGNGNPPQYSCLETYEQRSLAGYNPWDRKESDTTEHTQTHTHSEQTANLQIHRRVLEKPVRNDTGIQISNGGEPHHPSA